jgi:ribosomal protein S18 acetylase RimI-like enzyme
MKHFAITKRYMPEVQERQLIQYKDTFDGIEEYSLDGFCDGWKKPLSINQIKELVANSSFKVLVIDDTNKKIVGIITALSDNVNWAFIPYLEVLPEYQRQGIGTDLMKRMLANLANINCIDLTCDPEMRPFYERFGMLKSEGMVIRRYLAE